jgi:hypothetical protein
MRKLKIIASRNAILSAPEMPVEFSALKQLFKLGPPPLQ